MLNRTKFRRQIHAVGRNIEAARRAGIDADDMRIARFAICSLMAALGSIFLASRLPSVDTNAGSAAAVAVDSFARRRQDRAGRA